MNLGIDQRTRSLFNDIFRGLLSAVVPATRQPTVANLGTLFTTFQGQEQFSRGCPAFS